MYCRICGDEKRTRYYETKRQALCVSCAKDTPRKVSLEAFERVYWRGRDLAEVGLSVRREFYSDYLASTRNLKAYIRAKLIEGEKA